MRPRNPADTVSQNRRFCARAPLLVSHEMIGRMLLKNLAGLDSAQALRLKHPSDVVYKVRPALGTIEVLAPGAEAAPEAVPGNPFCVPPGPG
jgi:broad specificity phosphatase PhoE